MTDVTAVIALGVGLIAALAVFMGIRVTHFSPSIQDLGSDVTTWAEEIYELECKPEFLKTPVDQYKVMNTAAKYFSVKNNHNTLDMMELENKSGIKADIIAMIVMGCLIGFAVFSESINLQIPNILPEFFISLIVPTMMIVVIFALALYSWFNFWTNYSILRGKIKQKDEDWL